MSFIQAKPRATHDFYGPIHKGIRLALCRILIRLGAAAGDDEELDELLADLRGQCVLSAHHLDNEDVEVHAALEARAPGSSARLALAHAHHRLAFEDIETLVVRVEQAKGADRAGLLKALYLRFSQFVAEDFAHMAEEEQLFLPILQGLFSDGELMEIEDRIMSRTEPADMVAHGRIVLPAVTRAERIALLGAIRATAPAEAFAGLMEGAARPSLSPADFGHLCAGLGLAPR